jgi:TetR/AcrR family transcriptional regulator
MTNTSTKAPSQTPSRRERQHALHRSEIMEAAVELFYQQGYHGVTVQEIAQAAEFGIGTLYRLFPNGKEDIYVALQEKVVTAFESKITDNMKDVRDEHQIFRQYIRSAADVYAEYPREMAVYLRDHAGVSLDLEKGMGKDLAERYQACAVKVKQAVTTGMQKGLFRPMVPDAAVRVLRAVINGFFWTWLEQPDQGPAINNLVGLIEEVFLRGVELEN